MSLLRFKPTRDRVLVEAVHQAPYVGTLVVPEAHKERNPAEAVVVALGPLNKLPVTVGDRVLTARYNGTTVVQDGRSYRLLDPDDLLAKVD